MFWIVSFFLSLTYRGSLCKSIVMKRAVGTFRMERYMTEFSTVGDKQIVLAIGNGIVTVTL